MVRKVDDVDRDRAKDAIRRQIPCTDYLTKSKNGLYCCPICGSGTGQHATGALQFYPETNTWCCRSGKHTDAMIGRKANGGHVGDVIDLVMAVEGSDYNATLVALAQQIGIPVNALNADATDGDEPIKGAGREIGWDDEICNPSKKERKPQNFTRSYRAWAAQYSQTDYLRNRGISDTTASNFRIGYNPHFKTSGAGGSAVYWQAVILPTSQESYEVRNTDTAADESNRYRKRGSAHIFNPDALAGGAEPCFIVEGVIDALSIIEGGGQAAAIGSTANARLLMAEIKKGRLLQRPIIIALDNDEVGEKAAKTLEADLRAAKIFSMAADTAFLYGGQKDANAALLADRTGFIARVKQTARMAQDAAADATEQAQAANKEKDFEADGVQPDPDHSQGKEESISRQCEIDTPLAAQADEYERQCNVAAHLQEFINGIADSVNTPAIPTGFEKLDAVLDGGLFAGLCFLGANSSAGKTTFALQLADQIATGGQDVLIVSLEMARTELMSKSISRLTLLNVLANGGNTANAKTAREITVGSWYENYSQAELDAIQRAISAYGEQCAKHVYIVEGIGDIKALDVRDMVKRHRQNTGRTPVVVIDYLQILQPHDPRMTDKMSVDKSVLELKRLSRDYKTPVLAISSFGRHAYATEVSFSSYKESGAVEYSGDVLLGMQLKGVGTKDFDENAAKSQNPREIELVILKNRNGRTGDKLQFLYYPAFNYFREA